MNIKNKKKLSDAYETIVKHIKYAGYNTDTDNANLLNTAERASSALQELIQPKDEIISEIKKMLSKVFPVQYQGMVISEGIKTFGLCPHHLLPVIYTVTLAYIPNSIQTKVIGISKLARIAKISAKRPILQEQYTCDLANVFYTSNNGELPGIDTLGSAVYVEGMHTCSTIRGVNSHESTIITKELRGVFLENSATSMEFETIIGRRR